MSRSRSLRGLGEPLAPALGLEPVEGPALRARAASASSEAAPSVCRVYSSQNRSARRGPATLPL